MMRMGKMINRISYKKTLGGIAVIAFIFICVRGAFITPDNIGMILTRLLYLIGILFGIKAASGAFVKNQEIKQNGNQGNTK